MQLPAPLPLAATGQRELTLRFSPETKPSRSAAPPPRRLAPKRAGKAGRDILPASGRAFCTVVRREVVALSRDLVEAGRFVVWFAPVIVRGMVGTTQLLAIFTLFATGYPIGLYALGQWMLK